MPGDDMALRSHTRGFFWMTISVITPLWIVLVLFPRHTASLWMWAMRDPRSAILVGAVYVGATVYYVLGVLADDWLETQAGLEGIFVVSAVLLLAVALHWDVVRPWHLMTLIWMPAYYAPLFFVPYLFRLEGGWKRLPGADEARISPAAAGWLTVRGILYAALAAAGFLFAEPLSRVWPWPIDAVELGMFFGQPATFVLSALAVLRGNVLWRRHRLHLLYIGTLGVVQLASVAALRTPYDWSSAFGITLPLVFLEWIVTPLVLLSSQGARTRPPIGPATLPARTTTGPAIRYGVRIVGFGYLAMAVLGFLPIEALNPLRAEGTARYLLRHFAVDTPHNFVHLTLGVTALWASRDLRTAQLWGKVAGVVLLSLFAAGIAQAWGTGFPRDQSLLGIALNSAGHVFHLATGVIVLIFGMAKVGSILP